MWSFGCVLIEAAVWVCFGRRGRVEFQQRRRDENNEVAPEQRDLGRSDCFHDGKARLRTVEQVLDLVHRDGRRSDELTPKIVRLVLDHLLVEKDSRYCARLLATEMGKIIQTTSGWAGENISRCTSAASSAAHSHRSQDFRHSQHDGFDTPQITSTRPHYGVLTHSMPVDSMSQDQTSPTERASPLGTIPTRGSSVLSQTIPADSYNHCNGTQGSHRMDSGHPSAPLLELNATQGLDSRQSTISPVDASWFQPNGFRHAQMGMVGEENTQCHNGHTRSLDQSWPGQRAPTSGTVRPDPMVTQPQPSDHTRTTFPELSMEELKNRRAEGKPPKLRGTLPGEDHAMMFLKQRDHVSLRTRY